jgi:hypothetical protein
VRLGRLSKAFGRAILIEVVVHPITPEGYIRCDRCKNAVGWHPVVPRVSKDTSHSIIICNRCFDHNKEYQVGVMGLPGADCPRPWPYKISLERLINCVKEMRESGCTFDMKFEKFHKYPRY